MHTLRTVILTVAGGLLMAVTLFIFTAGPVGGIGGKIGMSVINQTYTTASGGYDPWTGEFRPTTRTYTDTVTGAQVTKPLGPPDYQNIRAIPLPVGFLVGSLLTLITIAALTRRKTASTPAPSPA